MLWPTVIEVVNISEMIDYEFLAENAIKIWEGFKEGYRGPPSDLNDKFYRWQQHATSDSLSALKGSEQYRQLYQIVEFACDRYLARLRNLTAPTQRFPPMPGSSLLHHPDSPFHRSSLDQPLASPTLMSWFAVHRNLDYHGLHTHTGDLVVAVFYAKSSPESGSLILKDPRGWIPPFGHTREIKPVAGQLVLFPAWLPHSALPTTGDDPRVMFAFNYGSGLQSLDWGSFDWTGGVIWQGVSGS